MDGSITKAIFCQHWSGDRSATVLSHPKVCLFLLHLPVKLSHRESLWKYLSFMRRFSLSYQVGVSGVHQRNISSISVPVLGLKPLSKCTKVYTSLAATCLVLAHLWCGIVSGSHQGKASRIYQAQTKIWLCKWRDLHRLCVRRKNVSCPTATPLNLFQILPRAQTL